MTAADDASMRAFWDGAAARLNVRPSTPQRNACRPSCCKTPYMCARQYRCACHEEAR